MPLYRQPGDCVKESGLPGAVRLEWFCSTATLCQAVCGTGARPSRSGDAAWRVPGAGLGPWWHIRLKN